MGPNVRRGRSRTAPLRRWAHSPQRPHRTACDAPPPSQPPQPLTALSSQPSAGLGTWRRVTIAKTHDGSPLSTARVWADARRGFGRTQLPHLPHLQKNGLVTARTPYRSARIQSECDGWVPKSRVWRRGTSHAPLEAAHGEIIIPSRMVLEEARGILHTGLNTREGSPRGTKNRLSHGRRPTRSRDAGLRQRHADAAYPNRRTRALAPRLGAKGPRVGRSDCNLGP